ncbi:MAG: hypothetical protein PF495_12885, partial [Spirochaetales bacterium]|nr:hypothetical protein [Spirochaetales bacterium]
GARIVSVSNFDARLCRAFFCYIESSKFTPENDLIDCNRPRFKICNILLNISALMVAHNTGQKSQGYMQIYFDMTFAKRIGGS